MKDDLKNTSAKGLWWKRFFYSATGANYDYEVGPNWFASVMGTGIIANASASLPLFSRICSGSLVSRLLNADRPCAGIGVLPVSTNQRMGQTFS